MGKRKEFVGTVVSDKMQKTIIVKTMRLFKDPRYAKVLKRYNKFKVHDEKNEAKVGDVVRIVETRPLSKDKHFRMAGITRKAKLANIELKEEAV
jgi:small subunit ribosomal protein S17